MGLFDVHCCVTGVPLVGPTALLPIARDGERWVPCALPYVDSYDRGGAIDDFTVEAPLATILDATRVPWLEDGGVELAYEDLLTELFHGAGRWQERPIAYTLVDGDVYRAHRAQREQDDATFAARVRDASWAQLVAWALPIAESRAAHLTGPGEDRAALIDLLALVESKPTLLPVFELGTGQHGLDSAAPLIAEARQRFAAQPAILAALARNEARRRQREALDEDEDADDETAGAEVVGPRLASLTFRRAMTGDHLLELSVDDGRILAALLARHPPSIDLRGPAGSMSIQRADSAGVRSTERGLVLDATPALWDELARLLSGPRPRSVELAECPGVRVRLP